MSTPILPLDKPEALIFDLDGTLFQTETLIEPAYYAMFEQLRKEGLYEGETPPVERILACLGMLLKDIWERVIPGVSADVHRRADDLLLQYQVEGLERGEGKLYDGVETVLRQLRERGVRLFVASNGLEAYVKDVVRTKGLGPLFEGLYSAGEYKTASKVELVRLLLDRHGVRSAWMVGDRSSDVEAGHGNGLTVIGCNYAGFHESGELDEADLIITDFAGLVHAYDASRTVR